MNPAPRRFGFWFLLLGLVACAAAGVWWHARTPADAPAHDPIAEGPQSAHMTASALSPELTAALAIADPVLRLHHLTAWVNSHSFESIVSELVDVSGETRKELLWLVTLKIRDLHPGIDPAGIQDQISSLFIAAERARNPQPPSLGEQLLTLAETDPATAFRKATEARIPLDRRNALTYDLLGGIARKDPRLALSLLATIKGISPLRARQSIVANWARTDPAGALAWARGLPASQHRSDLVSSVFATWGDQDIAGAIDAIAAFKAEGDHTLGSYQLQRWLEESPDESAAWINRQTKPDPVLVEAALRAFSKTHPRLAASLLRQPMSDDKRARSTETLARDWSRADPAAARTWLATLPPGRDWFVAATAIAQSLASTDPAAALEFYRALPEDTDRGKLAQYISGYLRDHAQALDWLLTLPPTRDIDVAVQNVISRLNYSDPSDYLALLGRLPPGPQQLALYVGATKKQLLRAPSAVSGWLNGLPTPEIRDAVIASIAPGWASTDRESAIAYARRLPAGPALDSLAQAILYNWRQHDLAAATAWAISIPAGNNLSRELTRAFSTLGEHDPQTASRQISDQAPSVSRSAALGGLVDGLAKTRPAEAAKLLVILGSSQDQVALIGTLAINWTGQNAQASTDWIKTLPANEARDRALQSAAFALSKKDPAAVLALLPIAQSDHARFDIARWALLHLQARNPDNAQATLDRMTLTAPERAQLQNTLNNFRHNPIRSD